MGGDVFGEGAKHCMRGRVRSPVQDYYESSCEDYLTGGGCNFHFTVRLTKNLYFINTHSKKRVWSNETNGFVIFKKA